MNKLLTLLCFTVIISLNAVNYHTPENSISPFANAVGGVQVANFADAFSSYYNPAMLGALKTGNFGISYKMRATDGTAKENISASKILSKGKLTGLCLQMPKGSFHIFPLVDTKGKITEENENTITNTYLNFELNSIGFSASHNTTNLHYGFSMKYLYGRKIYHYTAMDSVFNEVEFYDRKVKGYTTDLGFYYHRDNVSSALVFYDLVSQLYWDGSKNQHLKKQFAFGTNFWSENTRFYTTIMKSLKWKSDPSYHLGYEQRIIQNNSNRNPLQNISLRLGTYATDFSNRDKIGFTTGTRISFQNYIFEFAYKTIGFEGKNSAFYFGLTMGFQPDEN